MPRGRAARHTLDIWPGFVDALATLLIIIIFVLMVFILSQFYLSEALSGKDRTVEQLNRQIAELSQMLSLEQKSSSELRKSIDEISAELRATLQARDQLAATLRNVQGEKADLSGRLAESQKALAESRKALSESQQALAEQRRQNEALQKDKETTRRSLTESQQALGEQRRLTDDARAAVELLNRQIAELRAQLAAIQQALEASEAKVKDKDVEIKNMAQRLNLALVNKVEELQRYRSEFFGRLREVLGNRADVRIVGDRFVFQSELLFPTASARLEPSGAQQLDKLAATLKEIIAEMPKDIDWILRVDGHTDVRRINTAEFPSNWELSTARATAVVKYLIAQGIPAERLAATGFGEFQPIDTGNTEDAYQKNRRIEFKFTER
ncbi:MAG TPA: peptidoglycan -binding protein [Alphaproteobacteria bacterium]|jgi:chemotaxis protein MotB|nr:peptidoglycan -binding protein [Alphaproteobacteria bacterium]